MSKHITFLKVSQKPETEISYIGSEIVVVRLDQFLTDQEKSSIHVFKSGSCGFWAVEFDDLTRLLMMEDVLKYHFGEIRIGQIRNASHAMKIGGETFRGLSESSLKSFSEALVVELDGSSPTSTRPTFDEFVKSFPDDAKKWSKATHEILEVALWFRYRPDTKHLLDDGVVKDLSSLAKPHLWNTYSKKKIRECFAVADETTKALFFERFEDWFTRSDLSDV